MAEVGNTRDELMELVQLLAVEGAKIAESFAVQHGLHHTDANALAWVLVAQERGTFVTAGALAAELGLTSGGVTFVVDRLERAGHLTRVRDHQDRRRVLLHPSASARALAEELLRPAQQRTEAVMANFAAAELETVRRFLAATATSMTEFRESLTNPSAPGPGSRGPGDRAPHSGDHPDAET